MAGWHEGKGGGVKEEGSGAPPSRVVAGTGTARRPPVAAPCP